MEKNIPRKSISRYLKISLLGILCLTSAIGVAQKTAEQYFESGKAFYDQKKYEEAIDAFEEAVKLDESNAEYHYQLGASNIGALEKASFFKKSTLSNHARSNLIRAIELDSTHKMARISLANYYLQAPAIAGGSHSKALEQARALRQYDPVSAAELEANVYLHQEDYAAAERVYLDLIKKGQNNEKVYYRLSMVSLGRKNYQQAIAYCQKSIDNYPGYLMGYYQYGKLASIGKVNLERGKDNLEKYISSDLPSNLPKKHWAYYRLGKIFEAEGKKDLARRKYEKALSLKHGFKEAKTALNNLD